MLNIYRIELKKLRNVAVLKVAVVKCIFFIKLAVRFREPVGWVAEPEAECSGHEAEGSRSGTWLYPKALPLCRSRPYRKCYYDLLRNTLFAFVYLDARLASEKAMEKNSSINETLASKSYSSYHE